MIQQTSLEAFEGIATDLSSKQDKVLKLFKRYGLMCNEEVARLLSWPINCVTPRVLELRNLGLLRQQGTKYNTNNRKVMVWGA